MTETQAQRVEAEGSKTAKIALVGEAPGEYEVKHGRPFVGPAGQLLDRCLHGAGITRAGCYIINVIKERPPNDNISKFISFKTKGVSTTPEFEAYRQELLAELKECDANIIVALGGVALYALTGLQQIGKRRGSIYWNETLQKKVIACNHPSFALRIYLQQNLITHDLKRAKEESETREITSDVRNIWLYPSFLECRAYLESLLNGAATEIGFDIEVINEEVSCFAIATDQNNSICIPLMSKGSHYFDPHQEVEIWQLLGKVLEEKTIKKIGQNLIFDASFLFKKFGIRLTSIDDTMIGQAILCPDFKKDLGFITSVYTSNPYYKDEGKKHTKKSASYGQEGEEAYFRYNAKDAMVCVEAMPKILSDLNRQGNIETYKRQVSLIPVLMYMQERGMRVDNETIAQNAANNDEKITAYIKEFHSLCGSEINPDSPKQLVNYFYITKGYPAYKDRKTGKPTVDEDALKRLARKGSKEAEVLLEARKLTTINRRYYKMKLDEDKRIRGATNPVGTKTGRISSSKTIFETGGNMQNLPPAMKKYLYADEGYLLYNIDLSQAENRIVAHIAPDARMIEAFNSGIDVHKYTASFIFGIPIDKVSDEEGSSGFGKNSQRQIGKVANHALNYGLGPDKFSFLAGVSLKDAKFIRARYYQTYPGVAGYQEWVKNEICRSRTLTNCLGRKRLFLDRLSDDLFREGYDFIPQSTVADKINRDGLLWLQGQPYANDVEILNQVHDSIVFQIPLRCRLQHHINILNSIKASLESPLTFRALTFSIPADIQVGLNLGKHSEKNTAGLLSLKQTTIENLEALVAKLHA